KNEPVNINKQLTDLVKIMRESLVKNSKVKIKLDLEKQLPSILAKKDSLKQVFLNLMKNSIEAMPDGGELKINTRYIPNTVEYKPENHPQGSEGSLEITVCDEGVGIPPEIEPRVFEPLISTKKENHSGIGLSIVHGIVKALHGTIVCMNNKEKGATFKINLPAPNNFLT
ncbi:MAG: ATP-binding protein, partial [Desulfobacterales bacterium]|nr:ATP-binding protein [Desulfobacterales bacterium]